jgi:hypothetical protein
MHQNPDTGEAFEINPEEFLKNTAKSPFRQSVRDKTNFYFTNSDKLEKYLDTHTAP